MPCNDHVGKIFVNWYIALLRNKNFTLIQLKQFKTKTLYLVTYKTTALFCSVRSCFFGLQKQIILRAQKCWYRWNIIYPVLKDFHQGLFILGELPRLRGLARLGELIFIPRSYLMAKSLLCHCKEIVLIAWVLSGKFYIFNMDSRRLQRFHFTIYSIMNMITAFSVLLQLHGILLISLMNQKREQQTILN